MEFRRLGASGFYVPVLSFGAATFGGKGDFFGAWGASDAVEARHLVDICLEAGINMFDTADIYSAGGSEEVLGSAIKGRPRDSLILSTKATFRSGSGPNEVGSSRYHLIQAVEKALVRLGTDYIDLFQLHGFDARTPTEEVLSTLDALVRAGKIPERPNQVWSIDFVSDSLETGRRVKCLTIVDDFTKEAVDIVVDHGISGQYVTRVLDAAARFRELPRTIRTDQGPEFTGKAMDAWAYQRGIELRLIEAGKPTQNAYVESFNGKFRDECLNEHWFRTLAEARAAVAAWRADYNQGRPHSALEYLTPAEFAAAWRSRHAGSAKQIAES